MCADFSFAIVVAEGIHDTRTIAKFLEFKGFHEELQFDSIPEAFSRTIPTSYPKHPHNVLSWIVSHPSFFYKNDQWVLVSNANGESNLAQNTRDILQGLNKHIIEASLNAIAVISDADTKSVATKQQNITNAIVKIFQDNDEFDFDHLRPNKLIAYSKPISFFQYAFPDNSNCGTLEKLLIDGAKREYSDLLARAAEYVEYAKGQPTYTSKLTNFNEDKATVGVIANILRPGKANQISIHDDAWFTPTSLTTIPSHRSFSSFLDSLIAAL